MELWEQRDNGGEDTNLRVSVLIGLYSREYHGLMFLSVMVER